jgi:DNA-binding protein Fis
LPSRRQAAQGTRSGDAALLLERKPLISAALAGTRGNRIKAAELLGLNRNTLRKKINDLDIRLMRMPR